MCLEIQVMKLHLRDTIQEMVNTREIHEFFTLNSLAQMTQMILVPLILTKFQIIPLEPVSQWCF